MSTMIADGTYFLRPEGSAWIAATFRGGKLRGMTEEANAATHAAANDRWAGVVPSDDDIELSPEEAELIIREAMRPDTDASMVIVTRAAG